MPAPLCHALPLSDPSRPLLHIPAPFRPSKATSRHPVLPTITFTGKEQKHWVPVKEICSYFHLLT
ncbi:hypothetical protein E2C01_082793 [Portunus trituberculatus]|uniref:Uncharacterized protein n=1 Tax=Portunus trituberculatus TaxID=210409 RepID=A0A5B7J087_PORTR|nr:hypothetical protein [Portunus trituberculatus]